MEPIRILGGLLGLGMGTYGVFGGFWGVRHKKPHGFLGGSQREPL